MCFSPQADFSAGTAVALVGVQTLRRVPARRELLIGALPLLFGVHQLVEGFVWLGVRGEVSAGVGGAATQAYLVFAHAALPVLVPVGFLLLEPDRRRAALLWPFVVLGSLLGTYMLWQVTRYPVWAQEQAHCIDYRTHAPDGWLLPAIYVLVTCGPPLLSSLRYLRWFGVLNLLGAGATALVRTEELTSVWCVYAALVSVLVLAHFRRRRAPAAVRAAPGRGALSRAA
jgi:hypothetical protein